MSELKIGIIGGTGLGELLSARTGQKHELHTPFGPPSDAIIETESDGIPVLLLSRHGPGHLIPPDHVPFRANIFALKRLGCTHIIASGACGSLREEFKPRHLVIPDQILDRTTRRPSTFFEHAAVHVEFAEPFCPLLRQILIDEGKIEGATVHARGCYVCMEGPAFSTRAQSLMNRMMGGDLIGMTAMPEAVLAREAEIPYALVALATDYDCWRPAKSSEAEAPKLLEEILANLNEASHNAMELIRRALRRIAADPSALLTCPARQALKLAIWSDKSKIPPDEIQKLSPIWGKYFG